MYPGNQVAGIVVRIKGKEYRKIKPIYFFRLKAYPGFDMNKYNYIKRVGKDKQRTAFITDSFNRYIYVVYFPEKDGNINNLELEFTHKDN